MGLVDSRTGAERRLEGAELEAAARRMRALDIIGIHAAGSGHPGGTLSVMDLAAALYLNEARLDPRNPGWPERDRIIFSTGHKAPTIYAALAALGLYSDEQVVTLRKLGSPFQGHPHAPKLPGVEISSGSLGQGLGIAVGSALAARLDGRASRVYCLMGDGEQQEGSVWEAAMAAGHYRLGNLCAIVDCNGLQIDGRVEEVMGIDPLADKYRSFRWNVIEVDGHDLEAILAAFARARECRERPTVLLARTVKGKGVSFMEGEAGWHGVATKDGEQLERALRDIGCPTLGPAEARRLLAAAEAFQKAQTAALEREQPRAGRHAGDRRYGWNGAQGMRVRMDPTRFGFGRCLAAIGGDPRLVTLHADISGSIKITDFEKDHPERLERVFSVGIAEQNMMQVAAGLAMEGRIPITGTYGVFASGRPWDQIRTTICYDNLNVKIAGAHGGISVGADGATHQALEEIALMAVLPNMNLLVPCDSLETERLSRVAILDIKGPAYLRFAREATPVVTDRLHPARLRPGQPHPLPRRGGGVQGRLPDRPRRGLRRRAGGPDPGRLRADGGRGDARRLDPQGGARPGDAGAEHPHREAARRGGDRAGGAGNRGADHLRGAPGRRVRQPRGRRGLPAAGARHPPPVRPGRGPGPLRGVRGAVGADGPLRAVRRAPGRAGPRPAAAPAQGVGALPAGAPAGDPDVDRSPIRL